jgi:ribosomal protein L23
LDLKEKGIMEDKIVLEINLESDKRTIASILVANGYTVKVESVKNGSRSKRVLVAWRE